MFANPRRLRLAEAAGPMCARPFSHHCMPEGPAGPVGVRVVLFAFPSGQIFATLARISPGMAIMFSLFGRKRKKSSEHLNREIRLYPIKLRQLDDIELICAKPHAMLNFGVSLLVKDKGLAGLTTAIETLHALIERQVSPSVCYFSSGSRQTESLCIATPLSDG